MVRNGVATTSQLNGSGIGVVLRLYGDPVSNHFAMDSQWRRNQIRQSGKGALVFCAGEFSPEVQGVQRTPCKITGTRVNLIFGFSYL